MGKQGVQPAGQPVHLTAVTCETGPTLAIHPITLTLGLSDHRQKSFSAYFSIPAAPRVPRAGAMSSGQARSGRKAPALTLQHLLMSHEL